MNDNLRELVDEIQVDLEEFDEVMQAPATAEQLQALIKDCEQQLAYTLPTAYLDLLALSNGIDCNGTQLYAAEAEILPVDSGKTKYVKRGLVEANLIWRDYTPNNHYVFFAESGDKLYCHNLLTKKFEIVDRITKELIYAPSSFNTCEMLLETLLNHMLDRYGADEEDA